MNANHVAGVLFDMSRIEIVLTFDPIKRLLRNLIYKIERRSMVIRPVIRGDVSLEILVFVVGFTFRNIYDPVVVPMPFIQKISDLKFKQVGCIPSLLGSYIVPQSH